MKLLLLPLLLLVAPLASLAQSDEVEGLTTMEQERERGDAAAERFGEEIEDELGDAPVIDPDARPADIDPVSPLTSPGSPAIAPMPPVAPAPRLPGESEYETLNDN
jgi:hypothetical protein